MKKLIFPLLALLAVACNSDIKPDIEKQEEIVKEPAIAKKSVFKTFNGATNEPFWSVTVSENEMIFVSNLGKDTLRGAYHLDDEENTKALTYHLNHADVLLVVSEEACEDDMSGELFTHSIGLSFEGEMHKGCGSFVADNK